MKRPRVTQNSSLLITAILVLLSSTCSPIAAQIIIGQDDFDGNGVYLSRTIDEDVLGNGSTAPGEEAGVFGIFDRNVNAWFADDSLTDPTDEFGIIPSTKTDSFLAMQNIPEVLESGDTVSVEWTFDVAGFTDLHLSYDIAAMGGFARFDKVDFFALADGAGAPFRVSSADGFVNVGSFPYTLENGNTVQLANPLGFSNQIGNQFVTHSFRLPSGSNTLTLVLNTELKREAAVVAIDNLVVTGVAPFTLGDCDQDGDTDFADIAPFILISVRLLKFWLPIRLPFAVLYGKADLPRRSQLPP